MADISKWQKKNTKTMLLRLNIRTDRDILKHLDTVKSKQGYIKELIRADMKSKGIEIPHPSRAEEKKYAEYLCDLEFGEIDPSEDFKYETNDRSGKD